MDGRWMSLTRPALQARILHPSLLPRVDWKLRVQSYRLTAEMILIIHIHNFRFRWYYLEFPEFEIHSHTHAIPDPNPLPRDYIPSAGRVPQIPLSASVPAAA